MALLELHDVIERMLFLTLFAARTISPAAVVKRIGKEAQNEWWTIEGQHTRSVEVGLPVLALPIKGRLSTNRS